MKRFFAVTMAGLVVGLKLVTQAPVTLAAVPAYKERPEEAIRLRREMLVGTWYGDQPTTDGGRKQWIMRRLSDGTFHVAFRNTDPVTGREQQIETGEWGINAQFLMTVTRELMSGDGQREKVARQPDSFFWDLYEIEEITSKLMVYRSVESGSVYRVKKVPDTFTFPKEEK